MRKHYSLRKEEASSPDEETKTIEQEDLFARLDKYSEKIAYILALFMTSEEIDVYKKRVSNNYSITDIAKEKRTTFKKIKGILIRTNKKIASFQKFLELLK